MMDTTSILKKLYNELTKAHFEEDKALLLRKFLDLSDQKMFGEVCLLILLVSAFPANLY